MLKKVSSMSTVQGDLVYQSDFSVTWERCNGRWSHNFTEVQKWCDEHWKELVLLQFRRGHKKTWLVRFAINHDLLVTAKKKEVTYMSCNYADDSDNVPKKCCESTEGWSFSKRSETAQSDNSLRTRALIFGYFRRNDCLSQGCWFQHNRVFDLLTSDCYLSSKR